MNDQLPMTNEAVLRACFNIVAADVRRRRFGQLSSGNPPPHVGGYGVLKHALSEIIVSHTLIAPARQALWLLPDARLQKILFNGRIGVKFCGDDTRASQNSPRGVG